MGEKFILVHKKKIKRLLLSYIEKIFHDEKKLHLFLLACLILSFTFLFTDIAIVLLFTGIGAASLFHYKSSRGLIGFELCILSTLICSIEYGFIVGFLVGATAFLIGMGFSCNIEFGSPFCIFALLVISIMGSLSSGESIASLGIISTLFYDIFTVLIYIAFRLASAVTLSNVVTHIIINYFIFTYIAPIIVSAL